MIMTTANTVFPYTLPEGHEVEYMGWCGVHPWHRVDTIDSYCGPGSERFYGRFDTESYFQRYDRFRPDTLVGRVCPPGSCKEEVDPLIDDALAQKLNFPWMILNRDHTIRIPLDQTIAMAQRAIDEGLAELTEERRRRYLSATSELCLPLFPSGEYHRITLEKGKLRLNDDETAMEAIARYGNWYGVAPRLDEVHTASEVKAYRDCGLVAGGALEQDTPAIWKKLLPYIRDGRIRCADLQATYCHWDTLACLDRVNACRSFRRLITREGWPVAYAAEAVQFMVSLHFVAGDTDYDVGEELVAARPVFEEFLAHYPDMWDCVTGEAEFALWHMGRLSWEEYCARYKPAVHGIIETLGLLDVQGALRWFREYDRVRCGVFDNIDWDYDIFDRIDVGEDDAVRSIDDLFENDCDDVVSMPNPMGWNVTLDPKVALAAVKRLGVCLAECPDRETAYTRFAEEHARIAEQERTVILQRLLYEALDLEVGSYAIREFQGGRPFLDERIRDLELRAGRLIDELEKAPQGTIVDRIERDLLFVCVEAMVGMPVVTRMGGTVGKDLRYRVEVPGGSYEIAEKRLGIDQMRQDQPGMERVLAQLDNEGWEVLWDALESLWECVLVGDCDIKLWADAPLIGPSLKTEEGRTAAFVALLHCRIKELAKHVTNVSNGRLSVKGTYSWTLRLFEPLDEGLEELGMPSTGLGRRLHAIYEN